MDIGGNAVEAISTGREGVEALADWFRANWAELPIGLAVAAGIVLVMLGLRWLGAWLSSADPDCRRWRGVIGRVLHKTSIFFMIVAALDIVATYAAVPAKIERLLDILFTIGFAFQGAIWARELILGVISRKAGEDPTETAIGNALAVIRVLISVTLFAIAIIVILDNLGVNVTALVAGLGIGGIAIGLAAQGIFSDLFAALSILFDKPFRRGDVIQFDKTHGHDRADRAQDHAPALHHRRAGGDGQHQAARARDPQLRRRPNAPLAASVRARLSDIARRTRESRRRSPRRRWNRARAARSFAARSSALARRASISS